MLEELIPYYPSLEENDSQLVLYNLAEINVLAAKRGVERRLKSGEFFKHQMIEDRIMQMKDRLMVISDPGTGKTGGFICFDESTKSLTNLFKKFYYIIPSNLEESTKHQIICKLTNNKYINDKGQSGASKLEVKYSGKKGFSENYTMLTYDELYKSIKGKTSRQIEEMYNYCVFNIDEVTKLITLHLVNVTNKNVDGVVGWVEKLKGDVSLLKYVKDMDDARIINSDIEYIQYWRLFHIIKNSKVILGSGTPINNRISEFFLLINLILPLEKQMDVEYFANNIFRFNLNKYSPYLNGIISYVKASNVVARPNYIGTLLNRKYKVEYPMDELSENPAIGIREYNSQIVLYKVEMFGYQAKLIYLKRHEIYSELITSKTSQYLCYVDKYGRTGSEANNDVNTLIDLMKPGFEGTLLRQYCCSMFTELVRIEYYALANAQSNGKLGPGVCFNYMSLTETAIGSLKFLFRLAGFEVLEDFRFLEESGGDYCNIAKVTFRGLIPRPRVVFLTGDSKTNDKIRRQILQIAGSKDNIYGQYIQWINGSSVMGVGVNIGNGLRMTRPLPEWNDAKDRQSRDRVFREDAHDGIRELMANEIASKTGVKPGLYDFDVFVDVYNMCGFARYFYLETDYVNRFIKTNNLDNATHPFQLGEDGKITVDRIPNGKIGMLIDTMKIYHLVGFVESGKAIYLDNKLVSEFAMNGEILQNKIFERTQIEISDDLSNLLKNNIDIIISESGIIRIFKLDPSFKDLLKNHLLIYYDDCHFMIDSQNGFHDNISKCIIYKNDKEYELLPLSMYYISPSERQYIQVEEKSFGSKRILKYAQQFAVDCIANEERNFNPKDKDGSIECNYDVCKYTCSSKILPGKSKDSFIYENDEKFWSNYEVLYSSFIIEECKERIIKMLKLKEKVNIFDIVDKLTPEFKREYFINMAIYELIVNKVSVLDSFGTTCYICSNDNELYISRNFPKLIKSITNNTGDYTKKLIAIDNNPDYRLLHNVDDAIIKEIENIYIDPNTPEYDTYMIGLIVQKILQFKMYQSNFKLVEKSFGRIAYTRTINQNYASQEFLEKPIDRFIAGEIYSIRCFVTDNSSGVKIFFHNQPQVKFMRGDNGEISKLLNATDPFRIFSLDNNKPNWRNATVDETDKLLREEAKKDIKNRIDLKITKQFNIPNVYGILEPQIFVSMYYVNYYNGNYRLATNMKPKGKKFDTLDNSDINPFIGWVETSIWGMMPYNQTIILAIKNAIISGKESDRNELILKFFKDNDLIFYFSVETLAPKKKGR